MRLLIQTVKGSLCQSLESWLNVSPCARDLMELLLWHASHVYIVACSQLKSSERDLTHLGNQIFDFIFATDTLIWSDWFHWVWSHWSGMSCLTTKWVLNQLLLLIIGNLFLFTFSHHSYYLSSLLKLYLILLSLIFIH
jgi:hypothetical protein